MRVRILGSAAGGGLPQWNCGCPNCRAVRSGLAPIRARTQSSVAISADDRWWFLLNVSPDVRHQLLRFDDLGPDPNSVRGASLAGCVLTDAEMDHASGLLQLREGCRLPVISTELVHRWLSESFPIEPVLTSFSDRPWLDLPLEVSQTLALPDGSASGLTVQAFETGRDVPRFVAAEQQSAVGSVIGLEVTDSATGAKFVYAPCVPLLDERLQQAAQGGDLLLMDGTFWTEDEPQKFGISTRSSSQMGHVPVSGADGSLAWLAKLPVAHRVYVHINNTNPMLDEAGQQHGQVRDQGVEVGVDGQEFVL